MKHISTQEVRHVKGTFDLLIIGGGSAAFAAAAEASTMGARVGMIERGTIGGTCVNVGCIPSKALLQAADLYARAAHHPFQGMTFSPEALDVPALLAQKDALVETLVREKYIDLLAFYGITLISGEGAFVDAHTVQVNGAFYRGEKILIATGTRPAVPYIPGLTSIGYWTSTEALQPSYIPEHLIIIGAGYIALELGLMYRALGSRVTLIQRGTRLLRTLDADMSEVVQRILKKKGIQVLTGARIERIEGLPGAVKARQKVRLTISLAHPVYHEQPSAHHEHASIRRDEAPAHRNHVASYRDETIVPPGTAPHEQTSAQSIQIEGERLLLATGRTPNTERLRLERAGVQLGRRGEIIVDETLATHTPHIFAAGDVTLGSQYVYVAAYEGKLAAHNALSDNGGSDRIDRNLTVVHSVIFTDPQIATVGLTEEAARTRGLAVTVARLSLTDIARARVRYEEEGAYKLIFDQASLRLLGAEIIAPEAGEVIYAATLAVKFGLTRDDLVDTFVPYLTMAEGLRLTALSIQKDVRKLSCCAG